MANGAKSTLEGTAVGGGIGALFGGVGAVPGAAIGGVAGSFLGTALGTKKKAAPVVPWYQQHVLLIVAGIAVVGGTVLYFAVRK